MSGRVSLGGRSTNPAAYGASTQYSSADPHPLPSNSILLSARTVHPSSRACDSVNAVGLIQIFAAVLVLLCFALAGVLLGHR